MIVEVILLGLVIGWLMKGSLWRLSEVRLGWLVFVPAILLGLSWAVKVKFPHASLGFFHIIGSFSVLALVLANCRVPGAILVLLGVALNAVAIISNGWTMPAAQAAIASVFGDAFLKNALASPRPLASFIDDFTVVPYLCDIIPVGRPFFLSRGVYSVGDMVMTVGIFIAIITLMRRPAPSEIAAKNKRAG